jgi:hypothetical protein
MSRGKKLPEPRELGHGYVEGPGACFVERVSRARKRYRCDGPLRAVRDDDDISPGTGDSLRCSHASDCTQNIEPGDLYVYLLPHEPEVYGSYWVAHRTCIKCAMKEDVVQWTR